MSYIYIYIYVYIYIYIYIKSKGIYKTENLVSNGSSRHDDAAHFCLFYFFYKDISMTDEH